MSLGAIYDIAASGMNAQSMRMNTTASNIANAQAVAGSAEETYKPRHPIFAAVMHGQKAGDEFSIEEPKTGGMAVQVLGIYESDQPGMKRFQPNHPLADEEGYVYSPDINVVEEMTNMISASRSFQINVEVMNSTKSMLQRLLTLGQ